MGGVNRHAGNEHHLGIALATNQTSLPWLYPCMHLRQDIDQCADSALQTAIPEGGCSLGTGNDPDKTHLRHLQRTTKDPHKLNGAPSWRADLVGGVTPRYVARQWKSNTGFLCEPKMRLGGAGASKQTGAAVSAHVRLRALNDRPASADGKSWRRPGSACACESLWRGSVAGLESRPGAATAAQGPPGGGAFSRRPAPGGCGLLLVTLAELAAACEHTCEAPSNRDRGLKTSLLSSSQSLPFW